MAVLCSHCGEELMGAVNRCWRCGTSLQAHAGPQDIPPIRRAPITGPLDAALDAVVISDPVPKAAAVASAIPPTARPVRRGSPFAAESRTLRIVGPVEQAVVTTRNDRSQRQRSYQFQIASKLASVVALVLGLIALLLSFAVPVAAVSLGVLVVGFGTWGLFGEHRTMAIVALIIGSIVLAWAGFGTVVQIYEWMYGVSPFETNPLPPVDLGP